MAAKSGTYVKYLKEEREEIGKYALHHGIVSAVRHFVTKYPRLCRSSCRNLRDEYKESLRNTAPFNVHSSGTENTRQIMEQKTFVRKVHKGSYMKFSDVDRDIIAKTVIEKGASAALHKFKPFFPRLRESTCRYLRDRFIKSLGLSPKDVKGRSFLSKLVPSVSYTSEQERIAKFNGQEEAEPENVNFRAHFKGENLNRQNVLSSSPTGASGRNDNLTASDINNLEGNYESLTQVNLRTASFEDRAISGSATSDFVSSRSFDEKLTFSNSDVDRKWSKSAIRLSKGRYNKFCREEKDEIGRYAYMYGTSRAMRHLKSKFPQLKESTCRHLRDKYASFLKPRVKVHEAGAKTNASCTNVENEFQSTQDTSFSPGYLVDALPDKGDLTRGDNSLSPSDPAFDTDHRLHSTNHNIREQSSVSVQDFQETEHSLESDEERSGADKKLLAANAKRRGQYNKYDEDERCEIGMFAAENGIVTTLRHFKDKFPNLNESTCRNFRDKYNLSVGLGVSNDVSEFDPVSFVDVYSNVKLSGNSEGIPRKEGVPGEVALSPRREDTVRHAEPSVDIDKDSSNFTERRPTATVSAVATRTEVRHPQLLTSSVPTDETTYIVTSDRLKCDISNHTHMEDMSIKDYDDYSSIEKKSPGAGKAKVKRGSYCKFNEDAKIEIGKFASRFGVSRTYMHFQPKYPRLKESTCRYFKELYEKELKWKDNDGAQPKMHIKHTPTVVIKAAKEIEQVRTVPENTNTAATNIGPVYSAPNNLISKVIPNQSTPAHPQYQLIRTTGPNVPAVADYNFVDSSTNLQISNVESLRTEHSTPPQPVRIKIEDDDNTNTVVSSDVNLIRPGNGTNGYATSIIATTSHRTEYPVHQVHNSVERSSEANHNINFCQNGRVEPNVAFDIHEQDTENIVRIESSRKRGQYTICNQEDLYEIGKFASEHGPLQALRHFRRKYPRISESTVRFFRHKYILDLKTKGRGRIGVQEVDDLGPESFARLTAVKDIEVAIMKYLRLLRADGGSINVSVALSMSRGIIESKNRSLLTEYGGCITLTKGWMKSLLDKHCFDS